MRYIFRKKELIEQLKEVDADDFIMIKMGGHMAPSHPITHIEDSQHVGFWEIRCNPNADFWEELEKAKRNDEL